MKNLTVSFTDNAFNHFLVNNHWCNTSDLTSTEELPLYIEFIELQKASIRKAIFENSIDTPTLISDKHFTIQKDGKPYHWLSYTNFLKWIDEIQEEGGIVKITGRWMVVTFPHLTTEYQVEVEK